MAIIWSAFRKVGTIYDSFYRMPVVAAIITACRYSVLWLSKSIDQNMYEDPVFLFFFRHLRVEYNCVVQLLQQTTGIGKCQNCQHRAQRNHIVCCLWIWACCTPRRSNDLLPEKSLLDNYMPRQLEKPSIVVNIV